MQALHLLRGRDTWLLWSLGTQEGHAHRGHSGRSCSPRAPMRAFPPRAVCQCQLQPTLLLLSIHKLVSAASWKLLTAGMRRAWAILRVKGHCPACDLVFAQWLLGEMHLIIPTSYIGGSETFVSFRNLLVMFAHLLCTLLSYQNSFLVDRCWASRSGHTLCRV